MSAALGRLVRQVRRRVDPAGGSGDSSLLARWVDHADQSAFELLMWRHGPMVWATCLRVLRQEQDAEDAFQATFLALARKAASVRSAPSLAGWLYRVAFRAALAARSRHRLETVEGLDEVAAARPDASADLRRCLDEEVQGLPERYRESFVLCYLEGMTTDEAAAALGCPRGTVGTRVAWARQKLRQRLARRGLDLPSALPCGGVPSRLIETVLEAAGGGPVAPAVAELCQGVITMLFMNRAKCLAVYLLPVLLAMAGVGGLCLTAAEKPAKGEDRKPGDKPKAKPADKDKKPDETKKPAVQPDIQGTVREVTNDGKTLKVLLPRKSKTDEEKTAELKLGDKTQVLFSGVGVGGAKVEVGQHITAWLAENSKDTAARAAFHGAKHGKAAQPSLTGRITAVGDGGKSITVLVKAKKNEEGVEKTIKLTDRTAQVFHLVGPGEAKLAKDMVAAVWLAEKSEDTAARVVIHGTAEAPQKKGGQAAAHVGVVTEVGKDGKSFTLTEGKKKGEEAKKVTLKLGESSRQVFGNAAPGKAKLEAGQLAMVWVSDSAKDTVSVVFFQPAAAKAPGLSGKVAAVAGDGKSFTLQLPPAKKNEEGKQVEVKLGEKTQVIFNGVGPGGAKITKDYAANVVLAEGSKDTAATVVFGSKK